MGRDDWAEAGLADLGGADPTILGELAPGERLAWEGRPVPGRLALGVLPIAAVGVGVAGFGLFWMASSQLGQGMGFASFGLVFLLAGAGMVLSPAWFGWKGARMRYAITDRRAIVCEPRLGTGVEVRSYRPEALGNVVRRQRFDGSGDLIFEEIRTRDRDGDRHVTRRGFLAVADVRGVESVLRSTLLADRPGP